MLLFSRSIKALVVSIPDVNCSSRSSLNLIYSSVNCLTLSLFIPCIISLSISHWRIFL
nr:MAG TPA: hypothetical protein [Bacteriophage sp.]